LNLLQPFEVPLVVAVAAERAEEARGGELGDEVVFVGVVSQAGNGSGSGSRSSSRSPCGLSLTGQVPSGASPLMA
jgi:hypothetical protein